MDNSKIRMESGNDCIESSHTRGEIVGVALAVTSALLWSSAFIFGRYLLGCTPAKVDAYTLTFFRFIIGSLVVFAFAKVRGERLLPSGKAQWRLIACVSVFLYTLMSLFNFSGQKYVSATTAALILESGPALLLLLWKVVSRDNVGAREALSVSFGLLGCLLVLNIVSLEGIQCGGSVLGQLLMLASTVSWVVGGFFNKRLMSDSTNKLALVGWCQVFSALFMVPVLCVRGSSLIIPTSWQAWGALVFMAIFPTGLAFMTWGEAAARLPLWKLSLMQNMTPVFTLVGATFLLGEPVTWLNVLGMFVVFVSLAVAVVPGRRHGQADAKSSSSPRD